MALLGALLPATIAIPAGAQTHDRQMTHDPRSPDREARGRPVAAEPRRITGRIELFPDGRIVRTGAPLPAADAAGARPASPDRRPGAVAEPRFSPGRP